MGELPNFSGHFTGYISGYFLIARSYVAAVCLAIIWSLARVSGSYLFWLVIGLLLISYFFIQIAVWEWFTRVMCRIYKCRIILSAGLCTCFIIWMERGALFLFGQFEGVPLFEPLIFLLDSVLVRWLIGHVGAWGTLFVVHSILGMVFLACPREPFETILRDKPLRIPQGERVVVSGFSTPNRSRKKNVSRGVGLVLLLILAGDLLFSSRFIPPPDRPAWLSQCAIVRPPFTPCCAVNSCEHINSIATELALLDSSKKIIFMPESAVPFPFTSRSMAGAALLSLSEGRTLLFGAHRDGSHRDGSGHAGQETYNTAFCLRDGAVIFSHDKTHGMVGLERLPVLLQVSWIMRGLGPLLGTGFFAQSHMPIVACPGLGTSPALLVLICSEFFYRYSRSGIASDMVVVALVNDAWFARTFIPRLLLWTARLRALELRRQVLYVSYFHADSFGLY